MDEETEHEIYRKMFQGLLCWPTNTMCYFQLSRTVCSYLLEWAQVW